MNVVEVVIIVFYEIKGLLKLSLLLS
jgi:hypothetical protein